MSTRRLAPLLAAALGGTLLFAPSIASAGDDDDDAPRKKKRMTVTVEDNEDVDQEEAEEVETKGRRKRKRPDPPEVGASAAEIEVYLGKLKAEADIAKEKAKAARRGDSDLAAELQMEAEEAKVFYTVERDRLTERNIGMIAGGGTLVGLGVVSFVASFVLVIGWGISSIDGNPNDEYGWASLGCLGGAVVGVGVGTPLIVIGSIREPKQNSDAKVTPPTPFGVGTGIQISFPF